MKAPVDSVNHQLLALTESFANGAIGPAEFRRRRRELVCGWTGEQAPQAEPVGASEDDTQPMLAAITDEDVAQAQASKLVSEPAAAPLPSTAWRFWVTVLLLTFALTGAGALLWFVLRSSV